MILAIFLLLTWPGAGQQPTQESTQKRAVEARPLASLTQAIGEVMVRRGQTWARVDKVPVELASGDAVTTDRGRAEIHFLRDDSVLVLDVGTHLTITEADEAAAGKLLRRVEILLGDVWFKMQRSLNHKTELATPTAVGGLRGTQGSVHVENQEKSEFTLAEGQLEITERSGGSGSASGESKSVILNAGQTMQTHRGQPLQTVKAASVPARPALTTRADELPKPRDNWREMVSKTDRPPATSRAAPISTHPFAQGKTTGDKKDKSKSRKPANKYKK